MAKKKKETNYSEMPADELVRQADKAREDLFKLRFRAASAPLSNTMQIRTLRREIARLETFKRIQGRQAGKV